MPIFDRIDRKVLVWVPSFVWAFILFFFAVITFNAGALSSVNNVDKMAHFIEYLVLAFLVMRVFSCEKQLALQKSVLFTLILSGGYGILLELVQHFIPAREASLDDVFFNFVGVIAGITAGKLMPWRK
ncbi:MAG: VanZ family protein [Candidatus Omnitrophota bacterium]|nr:VanZ family protein [Candidatus Omnitrophota bacterium]